MYYDWGILYNCVYILQGGYSAGETYIDYEYLLVQQDRQLKIHMKRTSPYRHVSPQHTHKALGDRSTIVRQVCIMHVVSVYFRVILHTLPKAFRVIPGQLGHLE